MTRPEIPLALFKGMTDLENALYYVGLKDRNEQRLAGERSRYSSGVSWSGMSSTGPAYTPKTYDEMLAEAEAKVFASSALKMAAE